MAFLISTPESGIDSIALTYSLMDPIMTVIRPITAFVSGTVAGLMENFFGNFLGASEDKPSDHNSLPDSISYVPINIIPAQGHFKILLRKFIEGQKYAFTVLLKDIAGWFILGIFLAGVISSLVPDYWIATEIGSGITAYLFMLILSLPIYVCATFSTPVAAAMVLKGLSPGAALIFLIAGPATNVATLTTLAGILNKRALFIYIFAIIVCALVFAFFTDYLYSLLNLTPQLSWSSVSESNNTETAYVISSAILAALLGRAVFLHWKQKTIK